ncbi:MAG: GNAT family N-acetyltransferase [Dehalococcoidia bacterium]
MTTPLPPEQLARLRDGAEVRIRPIRPDDAQRLREFHDRLSPNTTRLRFFSPLKHLSRDFANRLTAVDFAKRCAFVISPLGDDTIHGVGRYEAETRRCAEIAFVVEDSMQGLGIGKLLLDRLVEHAREQEFTRFSAVTLCENSQMLALFRESPYHAQIHVERDLAFVRMDIRPEQGSAD